MSPDLSTYRLRRDGHGEKEKVQRKQMHEDMSNNIESLNYSNNNEWSM